MFCLFILSYSNIAYYSRLLMIKIKTLDLLKQRQMKRRIKRPKELKKRNVLVNERPKRPRTRPMTTFLVWKVLLDQLTKLLSQMSPKI